MHLNLALTLFNVRRWFQAPLVNPTGYGYDYGNNYGGQPES